LYWIVLFDHISVFHLFVVQKIKDHLSIAVLANTMKTQFVTLGVGNDSQIIISFHVVVPSCNWWDLKLRVNCIVNCIEIGVKWLELYWNCICQTNLMVVLYCYCIVRILITDYCIGIVLVSKSLYWSTLIEQNWRLNIISMPNKPIIKGAKNERNIFSTAHI
jgi:hypothetical protein